LLLQVRSRHSGISAFPSTILYTNRSDDQILDGSAGVRSPIEVSTCRALRVATARKYAERTVLRVSVSKVDVKE